MAGWKERIERAIQERNRNLQLADGAEAIRIRTQEESRRNTEDRIRREEEERRLRIETMLKELNAEELLRKTRAEIWEGYGNIPKTENGIRLVFGFNTVISIQVNSGWGGTDGGGSISTEAEKASGITFTEVSVDDISRVVTVEDGEIRGIPESKRYKNKWNAFITKGGQQVYSYEILYYRDTIERTEIPFEEATASVLEKTILQFGVNRITEGRLPRQLKR